VDLEEEDANTNATASDSREDETQSSAEERKPLKIKKIRKRRAAQ
jgi:hypothetical protein